MCVQEAELRTHLSRISTLISGLSNSTLPSRLLTRRLPRFSSPVASTHSRTYVQVRTQLIDRRDTGSKFFACQGLWASHGGHAGLWPS